MVRACTSFWQLAERAHPIHPVGGKVPPTAVEARVKGDQGQVHDQELHQGIATSSPSPGSTSRERPQVRDCNQPKPQGLQFKPTVEPDSRTPNPDPPTQRPRTGPSPRPSTSPPTHPSPPPNVLPSDLAKPPQTLLARVLLNQGLLSPYCQGDLGEAAKARIIRSGSAQQPGCRTHVWCMVTVHWSAPGPWSLMPDAGCLLVKRYGIHVETT